MTTQRWIAGSGQGLTWGSCFGAEVNSLGIGNAIASSVVISNATPLDVYCDFSLSLGSVTTIAGPPYVGLYFYILNADGTSYGDGQFASAAAGPPSTTYQVGSIAAPPGVTAVITGSLRGIVLPPGSGKFVIWNNLGVALAASANTLSYRTYNLQDA